MMNPRHALITGIGGQDGTYLTEQLLAQGYRVTGVDRGAGAAQKLDALGLLERVELASFDICDTDAVRSALERLRPDVIFHLAAVSFVPDSWRDPVAATAVGVLPTSALLAGILAVDPHIHLVQAASSEVFGRPSQWPQDEATPLAPITPYGATKAFCLSMGRMYRERFDLRVSTAILYNHESPRRPPHFVSRKITRGAAAISLGLETELRLGNLDSERDWSYAGDIAAGLVLMGGQDTGGDFVLASGRLHTVGDLVTAAFTRVGLNWQDHVVIDPAFVRPNEAHKVCGNPASAEARLGWRREVGFDELVATMVDSDVEGLRSSMN